MPPVQTVSLGWSPFAVVISPGCVRSAVGALKGAEIMPLAVAPRVMPPVLAALRTKRLGQWRRHGPALARPARQRACFAPRRTPVPRAGAAVARGAGAAVARGAGGGSGAGSRYYLE